MVMCYNMVVHSKAYEANKRWRKAHPERQLASSRAYEAKLRAVNPSAYRHEKAAYARDYRKLNPEKIKEASRAWYAANKEKVSERSKAKRLARGEIGGGGKLGWASKLVNAGKSSSARRGHEVPSITKEQIALIWESQGGRCFWFNVPMDKAPNSPWKVSLDRLDNGRGYVYGNVVLASWLANRSRGNMSIAEFETALTTVIKAIGERDPCI